MKLMFKTVIAICASVLLLFVVSKCQKLMDLISELNKGYDVTISIGISFLEGEKSYDALFKKADIALYDAKKKGRDQIQFYE